MPIYSVQATITAATPDGALLALAAEIRRRPPSGSIPDTTGAVKAYQVTEWVSGIFTVGTSAPIVQAEDAGNS